MQVLIQKRLQCSYNRQHSVMLTPDNAISRRR